MEYDVLVKIKLKDEIDEHDYASYIYELLSETYEVEEVEVES